jgi:hypothetical protein
MLFYLTIATFCDTIATDPFQWHHLLISSVSMWPAMALAW